MNDFFSDDDHYTGPPLTEEMVTKAQQTLGYLLPATYLDLIRGTNGGCPVRCCFPTEFATSWAADHVEISGLRGIGGEWGIDSTDGLGSSEMIDEWAYPRIGVVICDMPSGGHDAIMLDYSSCGPSGEPAVVYVDEDMQPKLIAKNFESFLIGLQSCSDFLTESGGIAP